MTFDEQWVRERLIEISDENGERTTLQEDAMQLAREAHDRAVKGMLSSKKMPMPPIEAAHCYQPRQDGQSGCRPVDLHCKAQPRTLFEAAALAALSSVLAWNKDGYLDHKATARETMKIARAFVRAVREANSD